MGEEYIARTGRERRGDRDGNDRRARIARWLAQGTKLPSAVEMTLTVHLPGGDGDEIVARWERDTVCVELAGEIDALIVDAANDNGCTITATLAWVDAEHRTLKSKGFRARCVDDEKDPVRLDGTLPSVLQGLQRHNEAYAQQIALMGRTMIEATARNDDRFERVLTLLERQNDKLTDALAQRDKLIEAQETEREEALDLAAQAAEAAEQAQREAEEATKDKDDPFGKVLELTTKQFLSSGSK